MSAVGKAIFGGSSGATTFNQFAPASQQEQQFANQLQSNINGLFQNAGTADQGVGNLFRQHLVSFLNNNTDGQVSPQDLQNATQFVDQTFTQPAQNAVNQQVSDFQSQAAARAAAMGRDPNLDQSTNQSIANQGIRANLALQQERGARIQQQTQDIYNRGLGSLNAGIQGSGFLNQLGQQAFANRMGLLNQGSNYLGYLQRNRGVGAIGSQTSPGLLGTLSAGAGQLAGIGQSAVNIGNSLGKLRF